MLSEISRRNRILSQSTQQHSVTALHRVFTTVYGTRGDERTTVVAAPTGSEGSSDEEQGGKRQAIYIVLATWDASVTQTF